MSIFDEVEAIQDVEELERDLRRLEAAHRRDMKNNASLSRRVKDAEAEVERLQSAVKLYEGVLDARPEPPKWLAPKKPKAHSATVMLLLSDMHFDEVVRPEEMDFLNAYNRSIATKRLKRWSQNVVKLTRHYLSGVNYDGCVLMLGGDSFTGIIHEELKETNEDTLFGSLLYWLEQMAAAVDLLAEEFGKVHIESVPGNHGRLTRKPRAKVRARDNVDWLLAAMLAKQFEKDPRVTARVTDAADAYFKVYDHGHLLTHGDQVRGGGGIGGIWPPIKRMAARKAEHHMVINKPFKTLWLGHWHQLVQTPSLVINGSTKGYDEYAKLNNFGFEPPQQALALITPEHNVTWQAPVFCLDRKDEKW